LESPQPIGAFNHAYLRKVVLQIKTTVSRLRIHAVARR